VRLARAGTVLGLAEGVETALAAMQIFEVPVWASLGGSRLGAITIPPGVTKIILFGNRDKAGGEAVAKARGNYLTRLAVAREFPTEGCGDFAEEVKADIGMSDE
jgi:putative DNA primase/helicase